jgi:hypothetical protein
MVRVGSSCGGNGGIENQQRWQLHLATAYLQDGYYFGQKLTIVIGALRVIA